MSATETPIIEMTDDEYDVFLSGEVDRGLGIPLSEFVMAYEAGHLDEADPEVTRLAALLALGQNSA
jgi:hypothetical protein